jgi:hypothetical protein
VTYRGQRTDHLSRNDATCADICRQRDLVCDARLTRVETCQNNFGRAFEAIDPQLGVGCFMYYSPRDRRYRFSVAPDCDAWMWDHGFRDSAGGAYDHNAANCNCIARVPGEPEPEPEPDPMPDPMPDPEPVPLPPTDLIDRQGIYNRDAIPAGGTDTLSLEWPDASSIRLVTRGVNGGECPGDTVIEVYRGAQLNHRNDDADQLVCSRVDVNVFSDERLRVEVSGFAGEAVPPYSLVVTADQEASPPGAVGRFIFSEYIEGSADNKALELYNAGEGDAFTRECVIERYSNGANMPGGRLELEAARVRPGRTHVICANNLVSASCTQRSGVLSHNGNDAYALRCNGEVVDVFGRIGENPGDGWGFGEFTTNDHTLRRRCEVLEGDTNGDDAFDPAIEWESFRRDTLDGLGRHCRE